MRRADPALCYTCRMFAWMFNIALAGSGALDGRTFANLIHESGKPDTSETLVFRAGEFDPLDCHQYGFVAAAYTTSPAPGGMTFTATVTSPTEGAMTWTGTVKGDLVSGAFDWRKAGQAPFHYTFDTKKP